VVADQHRSPGRGHLGDDLRDQGTGDRVQPLPRLVEHQQAGPDQQRLRQPDLLRGALGQVCQPGVPVLGELQPVQPAVHLRGAGQAPQRRHPEQVLPGGERLLGREALRHPADHRWTVPDGAPVRGQHAGRELEQRGLAGAVAAQHHDRAAGRDDRVDGPQRPAGAAGVPEPDLIETHPGASLE
jgi:hypothetical protein